GVEDLAEEEEEEMESQPLEESEVLRCGTVAHMADFMLGCLSRDPRIRNILANSDYWGFTLLDPRYKENFSTLIPEASALTAAESRTFSSLMSEWITRHPCAKATAVAICWHTRSFPRRDHAAVAPGARWTIDGRGAAAGQASTQTV
ncbi:MAG: hypothetical protein U5L74_01025, partial [Ideonella sp.]|nr:hypothetical protein [Ideonella sp.]